MRYLVLNIDRKDGQPVFETHTGKPISYRRGLQSIKEHTEWTQDEMAWKLSCNRSLIARYLSTDDLELPAKVMLAIRYWWNKQLEINPDLKIKVARKPQKNKAQR